MEECKPLGAGKGADRSSDDNNDEVGRRGLSVSKPELKAPTVQRLKPQYDEPL